MKGVALSCCGVNKKAIHFGALLLFFLRRRHKESLSAQNDIESWWWWLLPWEILKVEEEDKKRLNGKAWALKGWDPAPDAHRRLPLKNEIYNEISSLINEKMLRPQAEFRTEAWPCMSGKPPTNESWQAWQNVWSPTCRGNCDTHTALSLFEVTHGCHRGSQHTTWFSKSRSLSVSLVYKLLGAKRWNPFDYKVFVCQGFLPIPYANMINMACVNWGKMIRILIQWRLYLEIERLWLLHLALFLAHLIQL